MKYLLSLSIWLLLPSLVLAQTGKVRGKVVDNTQSGLPGVSIVIKSGGLGAHTDEHGVFEISNINDGSYTLSVSSVGFKTRELPLTISQNEVEIGAIMLYEGDEILREVVVQGEREDKFSRSNTAYVAKLL